MPQIRPEIRRVRATVSARYALVIVAALCLGQASPSAASDFFVSPSGLSTNDGSEQHPLDLDTALSASGPVRPGDTVWLRGGVYQRSGVSDGHGNLVLYVSTLAGTAAQPIVVRQYRGERATLDGVLEPSSAVLAVLGSYTWFWGFEITNSHTDRFSARGAGIDSFGHHNRYINLVIHDTGQGIGFWDTGHIPDDSEIYGSVISHVGWEGSDRGHGHSIYVQNVAGSKRITDNILFDGFSYGVHAYTQAGRVDNLEIRGNVVFNHGSLSTTGGYKTNLLIEGGRVAQFPTVADNFAYFPTGSAGRNLGASICDHGTIQNNYLAGGVAPRISCIDTVVTGNTVYGPGATPASYPDNSFASTPSGVYVGIRPNAYEPLRANVVIYNWSQLPSVSVDLTAAGLVAGDTFEVRDVQNYFGPAVLSGVYNGAALFPMAGLSAIPAIGDVPIQPGHTNVQFGAFIVQRLNGVNPPRPAATLTVSPAIISSGESSTLSWWTSGATSVTIDHGIGAVAASSSQPIASGTAATYAMTATNAGGESVARAVTTVRPPASADGTVVPSALHIVDGLGAIWTMNGATILRNGAAAAGGIGLEILWSAGNIYSLGTDGVTWSMWSGTAWANAGTSRPAAPPPPSTPPIPATSPDGALSPPATQIVDASGAVWTISTEVILRNGAPAAAGTGQKILWSGGMIYVLDSEGITWWQWHGSGWIDVGSTQPGSTVTPPPSASPDGTAVPPATQIIDALGAVWTISGDNILRNGASAAGGTGVEILWSGGWIHVLGSPGGNWWRWLGAGWTNVGRAQPGAIVPTPPLPPPSGPASSDGTVVPPATQIVDALGAVWTLNGGAILRNGSSAAGGTGVSILWSGGTIYVLGSTGGSWWKWLGAGWTNVGPASPAGTVTPPPPPPIVSGATTVVQSFALNGYKRVLEGQWEGIRYASDGNVYFGSSTHSAHHGAAFFKYDPRTNLVTLLADDISIIAGEDPQTNPQGKLHSDIVEANGWLYMSTHFSSEAPGAYERWTGSHVIGYELATGTFRDYGVVHPNYTSYSGIGVDPARNYLYVYVTGENPDQVSYIYRINTVTGDKTNLGQVGDYFRHCFWMFVDRRGDVWFSLSYHNGDLRRIRGATGQIDVFPNALPPLYRWDVEELNPSASEQAARFIMWMQPLDGDRALFTLGFSGGMLYEFDSSKPIGSGQEFTPLKHIGYSDLGLALGANRVFYYQRANRGFGTQEAQDFHLLSVSLNPATGYAITDHGLLIDQDGRVVWRTPGMMTDGQDRVFMIGDWWTVPGDLGSLRYDYSNGVESYQQLPRGEFFAVANIASQQEPAAVPSLVLSPPSIFGSVTTTANRISLAGPAPAGGYSMTLASSDPSVAVPASVLVPEGATTSPNFAITTQAVPTEKLVTITATGAGATRTAILTVSPLELVSLVLSPTALSAGNSSTLNQIKLNGPAPAAGASIALSSSNPAAATVPATVIVPAGTDTSPYFTISAAQVQSATAVTITASYATAAGWSTIRHADLTVSPLSSPDGAAIPPATQIIDGNGAVWTINGGLILRNGISAAGGSGVNILWSGGSIYVLGSPGGSWWKWLGAGWTNVGSAQPGGTVTPPSPPSPPPPTGPPSSDGTIVPPATEIVDALGAVWTINGGVILRNGASAAGGSGVNILWSGGSIYVLGSPGGSWWKWLGAGWTSVGSAQPGGTVTPPSPPSPPLPTGTPSSDGTVVPPATQITDALGAVWTLNGEVVLRNGVPAAGGTGFRILWLRGTVYVLGSDNSRWWQWTGAGWTYFGTAAPV